jgi:demethylmenaquinone methyltransferase/2-methoxy-6-polyprenyl-1,4-benzoquinol methylase
VKYIGKKDIISYYYASIYNTLWGKSKLLVPFEILLEFLSPKNPTQVLEVGGGSECSHIKYVNKKPTKNYVVLDPVLPTSQVRALLKKQYPFVKFQKGVSENIPYPQNYFDHIKITCVLHHVNDLFKSLQEIRRVSKNNCEIVILIPTDPGFFNLTIKKMFTFKKINKVSIYPADLIYSLDHRNSIHNIISMLRYIFKNDLIKFFYLPFFVKSINLNLVWICKIKISK